jgi:hypothetical protein
MNLKNYKSSEHCIEQRYADSTSQIQTVDMLVLMTGEKVTR